MFGHQYDLDISLIVQSLPGCPISGASWAAWASSLRRSLLGGMTTLPFRYQVPESLRLLGSKTRFRPYWSTHGAIWVWKTPCWYWIHPSSSNQSRPGRSARRMNIFLGRSVRSWLSSSPRLASGGRESISATAWNFPGTCLIRRLYSWRVANQRATLLLTFLGFFQNVRLAWSVRIVTGVSVAATCGLQCSRALMTASNSRS